MSIKDAVTKNYLAEPGRFAQVYNNALFNGEKVILPEKLRELDPLFITVCLIYSPFHQSWNDTGR